MFPLFAAKIDVTQIFGTVILVISVLGWFVNVIQSNSANAAARQKKPNPKPQSGRSEIEGLLRELTGDKRKPKPEVRKEQQQPRPQKQQQNERRSKPNNNPPGPRTGQKPPVPARSLPRTSESALPAANLGDGIRSHQLGNRVDAAVKKEITAAVQQDLGGSIGVPALAVAEVHPLVAALRSPQGMRQAILLNEVLQRPKGLRHT